MRKPSFKLLAEFKLQAKNKEEVSLWSSFAQGMHPNPKFYKYRWWIFWEQSPVDGMAFLEDRYAIGTAAAMTLMNKLEQQKKIHWIYNKRLPRLEPGVTPFDPQHPKWKNYAFSTALSEDADPEWNGHR
jgi:hypothetical protein